MQEHNMAHAGEGQNEEAGVALIHGHGVLPVGRRYTRREDIRDQTDALGKAEQARGREGVPTLGGLPAEAGHQGRQAQETRQLHVAALAK